MKLPVCIKHIDISLKIFYHSKLCNYEDFFNGLKEVTYAHQDCIYFIKIQ